MPSSLVEILGIAGIITVYILFKWVVWKSELVRSLIALSLIAVGLYALAVAWTTWRGAPDKPTSMPLQEAVERSKNKAQWVTLTGTEEMHWDCASIVYWTGNAAGKKTAWMDVILTDSAQSIAINISFDGHLSCDELQAPSSELTGELSRFKGRDYTDYGYQGRLTKYQETATLLKMCTACKPSNTIWGLVIGGSALLVLGLVFLVINVVKRTKTV